MGIKYFLDNTDQKINYKLENAYYGNGTGKIDESLMKYVKDIKEGYDLFVSDVQENPIIWINGRSEIGPRALGHRSIIADSSNLASKDKLNIIKKRQWWRPVAPIVLEDKIHDWFVDAFPSKYMLNKFIVKEEKKEKNKISSAFR